MSDKTRGIYEKFVVTRADGSSELGGKHEGCKYFVLDITHDPFARPALETYANECEAEYPVLAADIRALYLSPPKPADAPPAKEADTKEELKAEPVDPLGDELIRIFGDGVRVTPNYGYNIPLYLMIGTTLVRTRTLLLFHMAGGGFQAYMQHDSADSVIADKPLDALIALAQDLEKRLGTPAQPTAIDKADAGNGAETGTQAATPGDLVVIRERVEALPDEPTFLKWNYNEYGMIRGVNTERAIANVFEKPYDVFYQHAPADVCTLLAALDAAEQRAAKAEVLVRYADQSAAMHKEQYGQEHDNAALLYRALVRNAPQALGELKAQLWQNTNEYDKLMSEASREREKRMRAEQRVEAAESALLALVNDMREVDWYYVPTEIQEQVMTVVPLNRQVYGRPSAKDIGANHDDANG